MALCLTYPGRLLRRHIKLLGRFYRSQSWTRGFASHASASDQFGAAKPDILIVGSGAAGMTAALRAHDHGLNPLIVEKMPLIGGCSGYSGGGLWIPTNGLFPDVTDSIEEALLYLETLIGEIGPASTRERKLAFLKNGPRMINFLKDHGFKWQPTINYPDYWPNLPGGKPQGRSIEGSIFNAKLCKEWFPKLNLNQQTKGIPLYTYEVTTLVSKPTKMDGIALALKVFGGRKLIASLQGKYPVSMGNSLIAQLAHMMLQRKLPIWTETALQDVVVKDGRVTSITVRRHNRVEELPAPMGVLLCAGGFAQNATMREKHHPAPITNKWTSTPPSDTGDAITAAMKIGAATSLMDEAWWGPAVLDSDGKPMWCQFERMLPHSMVVDKSGRRFTNESQSYVSFTQDQYSRNKTTPAVPAYLIMDSHHRSRYLFLGMPPGKPPKKVLESGMMVKADSLAELAEKTGIDPEGLQEEAKRFNKFAAAGTDEDFHRGESVYDNWFGDDAVKPNPNLGTISKPPYYAAKIWPGDLGTKGGILTDEYARALRDDGSVIEGLYAAGNSSASVMGRQYAGAGSTLGPAMTFAFLAMDHIASARE